MSAFGWRDGYLHIDAAALARVSAVACAFGRGTGGRALGGIQLWLTDEEIRDLHDVLHKIEGTIGTPDDRISSGTWATAAQASDASAQRESSLDAAGGGHSETGKAREPLVVVTEASATPARRKKLSPGRNQPPASGASPKPGGLRPPRPTFSDPGDGYDSAIRWHADFERGTI